MKRRSAMRTCPSLIVCVTWASISAADATTVEPMPASRLADHAAVVVDAVVESVQSRWSDNPREIVTEVRFASVDYWKGGWSPAAAVPAAMTLTVPGGTIGSLTMRIAGAPEFAAGQRWILFILPEYRVFPVVGLWEGAFRVKQDSLAVDRVHDASSRPVIGLETTGQFRVASDAPFSPAQSCVGAVGVHLETLSTTASNQPALSVAEFKSLMTPILAASRIHSSASVAGRRVPTQFTSTPLVPNPASLGNRADAPPRDRPNAPEAPAQMMGKRNPSQKLPPPK